MKRMLAWVSCWTAAMAWADMGGEIRWYATDSSVSARSPLADVADARPAGWIEAAVGGSLAAWRGRAVLRAPTFARDDAEAVLASLYWESGNWTIGRKAVSWDVGYAFRPLDVLLYERRRQIVPDLATRGTDMVAWQGLGVDDALDVVWINPGAGKGRDASRGDEALAARYYFRAGDVDATGVLHVGNRHRWQTGAGLATVVGEAWEFHGSALFLSHSETLRGLAGFQYAWRDGWQLLAEAWWDGTAPAAIRGGPGEVAAALRGENLNRDNVLARLGKEEGTWRPALEILYVPSDRGRVVTASLARVGDRVRVEAGFRRFGGPDEAALRLQPDRLLAWVSCRFAW